MKYSVVSVVVGGLGFMSTYLLTRWGEQVSTAPKLPPGQSEVETLQLLSISEVPNIALDDWTFEADGEVVNPLKLSWSQLQQLPKVASVSEFDCVTGWTILSNTWEGVEFREISKMARPKSNAKYVTIECYGHPTYTTSLTLDDLLREGVLFAYEFNQNKLEPEHGGPLRLVVPRKYGYKSAKWVRRVKFTQAQELGYWESRGYSETADPWTNDRYG